MVRDLKQHSHITILIDFVPHHLGLILVPKVAKKAYLIHIQVSNAADSAEF